MAAEQFQQFTVYRHDLHFLKTGRVVNSCVFISLQCIYSLGEVLKDKNVIRTKMLSIVLKTVHFWLTSAKVISRRRKISGKICFDVTSAFDVISHV